MRKTTVKGKYRYQLAKTECKKLFKAEKEALVNTYPVSRSGYAVALMTSGGNIYTGVSYISDTDKASPHYFCLAERK